MGRCAGEGDIRCESAYTRLVVNATSHHFVTDVIAYTCRPLLLLLLLALLRATDEEQSNVT